MDIREEIPIKSFTIAAYLCRIVAGRGQYLVIKRRSHYLDGIWQMVSGRVEPGEKAWEAALREIREETGLVPNRFYSANVLEQFYEVEQNCILLIPVFIGFVDVAQQVQLSGEHSDFRWISPEDGADYLPFQQQRETMSYIERSFVQEDPLNFLRIEIPASF